MMYSRLAARNHYSEAIDIYKRLLVENRDASALNVYIALCYYKLDYYDVSQEVLSVYMQSRQQSIIACNLKACNTFRLVSGKAAEAELRALADAGINADSHDLVRHNLVVFRNGDSALRVLPGLVDKVVPEARLNLVIYHLRAGNVLEAYDLVRDVTPVLPPEYIVQAICHTLLYQRQGGTAPSNPAEHLRNAQQLFNVVGSSGSECDTIPGRQCMASCYFMQKQFEDVNVYLSSVKQYMYSDDDFNWNYGISLGAVGSYKEAEEMLLLVQNPAYTNEPTYLMWLARCYIMNRKARQAWELYLKINSSAQSIQLLQLIANDCYKVGAFLYAAKAFDNLERLDEGDPEYWEGKRGACIGVFQQVVAGTESKENLREVLIMLRNTSNPQVEYITRTISRWAQSNGGL
jgi:intraflagellar transport protein 56